MIAYSSDVSPVVLNKAAQTEKISSDRCFSVKNEQSVCYIASKMSQCRRSSFFGSCPTETDALVSLPACKILSTKGFRRIASYG